MSGPFALVVIIAVLFLLYRNRSRLPMIRFSWNFGTGGTWFMSHLTGTGGVILLFWLLGLAVLYFLYPESYTWWWGKKTLFWLLPVVLILVGIALEEQRTLSRGARVVAGLVIVFILAMYGMAVWKDVGGTIPSLPHFTTQGSAPRVIPPAGSKLLRPGESWLVDIPEGMTIGGSCSGGVGEVMTDVMPAPIPCGDGVTGPGPNLYLVKRITFIALDQPITIYWHFPPYN